MNIEVELPSIYFVSAIILYLVVLFEMFYIWFVAQEKLKQFDLPLISNYSRIKRYIHHFMLPSLLYISVVGFIYYNNQTAIRIPIIVLSFIAFFSLFINLRAFYQDKFKLEESTYFVYDLIELMIFFTMVNIGFHFIITTGVSPSVLVIFIFFISLLLLTLNLYQFENFNLNSMIFVTALSLVPTILVYILFYHTDFYPNTNGLIISVLTFLTYYFIFGILSHKLDGSLKPSVIIEYISIFLLTLAFLSGIS